MPESLKTADGTALALEQAGEQQFARSMAAPEPDPGGQPDYPGPRRKRDPEAPFGRNPDGSPILRYGLNAKGLPAQNPPGPGRGGKKDDKPREQKPPGPAGGDKDDYSQDLVEFTDGLWMLMAGTPIPWARLAEFKIRIRCQAAILKDNQAGIVGAVNAGATHNATVRHYVEALTGGPASWVLPAMFLLAPFVGMSAAMWRAPVAGDVTEMAEQTERDWKAFNETQMKLLAQQSQLAAREQLLAEREHAAAA